MTDDSAGAKPADPFVRPFTTIAPTVGRIVWYTPPKTEQLEQVLKAGGTQ